MINSETRKYIDTLSDDALVAYVVAGTESYQQDAIEYAAQVLNARNLPTERRSDLETIARSTAAKK